MGQLVTAGPCLAWGDLQRPVAGLGGAGSLDGLPLSRDVGGPGGEAVWPKHVGKRRQSPGPPHHLGTAATKAKATPPLLGSVLVKQTVPGPPCCLGSGNAWNQVGMPSGAAGSCRGQHRWLCPQCGPRITAAQAGLTNLPHAQPGASRTGSAPPSSGCVPGLQAFLRAGPLQGQPPRFELEACFLPQTLCSASHCDLPGPGVCGGEAQGGFLGRGRTPAFPCLPVSSLGWYFAGSLPAPSDLIPPCLLGFLIFSDSSSALRGCFITGQF